MQTVSFKPTTYAVKGSSTQTGHVLPHLKSSRTRMPPCPQASGSVKRSKYANHKSEDTLFISAAASADSPATEQNAFRRASKQKRHRRIRAHDDDTPTGLSGGESGRVHTNKRGTWACTTGRSEKTNPMAWKTSTPTNTNVELCSARLDRSTTRTMRGRT